MNIAIVQARMSSTRLPGKVLLDIEGRPMIIRQIERIQRAKKIQKIIVATSTEKEDDVLAQLCDANNIVCFRGSLNNVLERFYQAARKYGSTNIIRITADCPLIDHEIIDRVITKHEENHNDYTSNTIAPSFPDGLDVEVFTFEALNEMHCKADKPSHIEHVTQYILQNKESFKIANFKSNYDYSHMRWTVDEEEDYIFVKKIYCELYERNNDFSWHDIVKLLEKNPELTNVNNHLKRNEGLERSLIEDEEI